jgi:predicted ATPase/DNA-binding winged helix-turn-helix (wHTH) protein
MDSLRFGEFELFVTQRRLLYGSKVVAIGSRALDLLLALVETPGEVVSKEKLIQKLWPGIAVDEAGLRVHVANLRKILRDGEGEHRYISNISGRGYVFVAPVTVSDKRALGIARGQTSRPDSDFAEKPAFLPHVGQISAAMTRTVGRDDIISAIVDQQASRRCSTIVGPGGIGKTTVALAVARDMVPKLKDGVVFIDLSPLEDGSFLAGTIAASLNIALHPSDPYSSLTSALRDKEILLVLDSCEHIIESAASLVTTLLRYTERVRVLSTSREALRVEGEWVRRIAPLATPSNERPISAAEAMTYPAIQLFVDRAADALGGYTLTDEDTVFVVEICSKLEGIALAIELAAGRVDTIPIRDLAVQLDDRFRVLNLGRRGALTRHQTLEGMMDWSYDRLTEGEQHLLKQLSIFRGNFSIRAVQGVCLQGTPSGPVEDALASLVAKSLVSINRENSETTYRLLDTTRSYAASKLEKSGELSKLAAAHAAYCVKFFEDAAENWSTCPSLAWHQKYVPHIENLRAALNWSFSESGDPSQGIALTIAAMPLWSQLSLFDEPLEWVGRSLEAATRGVAPDRRRQMQLHAALGGLQMYAISSVKQANNSWERALEIAVELEDEDYQLRVIRALWAEAINRGQFTQSYARATEFQILERKAGLQGRHSVSDRLIGSSLHFLGRQDEASRAIERMLGQYDVAANAGDLVRYQFNQASAARIMRGRVLWLQGRFDSAIAEVAQNVEQTVASDHTMTICNMLTVSACPISILAGDQSLARSYLALLLERTEPRALDIWYTYARCFDGELETYFGDAEKGLDRLAAAIAELKSSDFGHYITSFLATQAKGVLKTGDAIEARAAIEQALIYAETSGERWLTAELFRLKGETFQAELGANGLQLANDWFEKALKLAREQNVIAWELRAANSIARLNLESGQQANAREVLEPIYDRFVEGFSCPDLVEAATLLNLT